MVGRQDCAVLLTLGHGHSPTDHATAWLAIGPDLRVGCREGEPVDAAVRNRPVAVL